MERRAQSLIAEYAIRGRPDTRVEQLSGGNQQRTLLALIPSGTRLLLAEHPTRGLDVESATAVWMRLRQRCDEGASLLFSSSDPEEILRHSDRFLVFANGKALGPFSSRILNVDDIGRMIGGKGLAV